MMDRETKGYKDAREMMILHGPDALREAVLGAESVETEGMKTAATGTPETRPGGEGGSPRAAKPQAGGGPGEKQQAFPIMRVNRMRGAGVTFDFVEGLLTEGGASVIYGPSNCGKSFWVVDLGVCVATGQPFRDEMAVDVGAVVYVALEGGAGAMNRIEALKLAGKMPDDAPFFVIFSPVSLLERDHSQRLVLSIMEATEDSGLPVRLVILDTMARAMAGGDENNGQDMTAAMQSIDAIRAETGAHVAVIHHSGKDPARGARGHSSLRAAVDTEIEIVRLKGETISTVRVTKQRDLLPIEAMPFSLKVVEVGVDRRGKPITSCVVQHEDEMAVARVPVAVPLGRKPLYTDDELLDFLPAASVKGWLDDIQEKTGMSVGQIYKRKKLMFAAGRFRVEKDTGRVNRAEDDELPISPAA